MSEMLIDIRISEHPKNPTKKREGFFDIHHSTVHLVIRDFKKKDVRGRGEKLERNKG